MKLLTIIGARPQFIKAATVSRVIEDFDSINEVLVHTGQHYDKNMSDVFFDELNIPRPQYNLGIGGGGHGYQTGKMILEIEKVLFKEKPDILMVYGDTNSTLAGTLAAVKLHIPVAHVEAGLRSFNRKMPEEINRVLTDHASDILFAPTKTAIKNLVNEGVSDAKLKRIGDVMYDAAIFYSEMAERNSSILEEIKAEKEDFILVTVHRAENTDDVDKLSKIFEVLNNLATQHNLVLPLHPRTKKSLESIRFSFEKSGIKFIEPVGYLDMVSLEMSSKLIITDSGGVQKEAYFHKRKCVTLRDETEWVELLDVGWNALATPFTLEGIVESSLSAHPVYDKNLYGDGTAGEQIVSILSNV